MEAGGPAFSFALNQKDVVWSDDAPTLYALAEPISVDPELLGRLIESFDGVAGIWGAEIGRDALPVREHMRDKGVVARSIITRIAVCPPLVITDEEIATVLDSIESAIVATRH